jgi:hypothetical protein
VRPCLDFRGKDAEHAASPAPSEHPFSAALIETRRKIARAAEQSVLTEVFGFPIPAAPRFIAPEHFAG